MRYIAIILIVLLPRLAWSIDAFELPKNEIKYIYDGDTFYIHCQRGLRCKNGKLGIRALGLDTPELRGECEFEKKLARKAKRYLVALKDNATTIVITPNKKRPYDKYNRLLASVSFDGVDWSQSIIEQQLGRAWNGRRGGWC